MLQLQEVCSGMQNELPGHPLPQVPPHESLPQTLPEHCGVQPHFPAAPAPPQLWVPLQVPQLVMDRGWPQLSLPLAAPHERARRAQNATSDSGAQTHLPAVEQELGALQVPQLPPHPSSPHVRPEHEGRHPLCSSWVRKPSSVFWLQSASGAPSGIVS